MQSAYLNEYNMMMQNGLDGSLEQQYLLQQQQQQQLQLQQQQQQQQLAYQQQMNQLNQANQMNQLNQINQLNQLNQVGQVTPGVPLNPNVIIQPPVRPNQFQIASQPIQPAVVNQFATVNSSLAPPVTTNPLLNPTVPQLAQPNATLPVSPMLNSNQSPLIAQSTLTRNRPAHPRPMPKSNEISKSGNNPDLDKLDP